MPPDKITIISVALGAVVAGLTWFGWELAENVSSVRRERAQRKEDAAAQFLAEQAKKAAAAKEQVGPHEAQKEGKGR